MLTSENISGLVYCFLCLVFVIPPQEVAAAGLTIQNLFGGLLGDERVDFIKYHIRRASVTLVVHAFLPLGYVLVIAWTNAEQYIYQFSSLALLIQIGFISSIVLPLAAVGCVLLWSQDGWAHHPLMLKLKNLYPSNEPSRSSVAVANAINVEMRRPDLFSSGHYSQKVHVTDNWIIKIGTYNLDIAHQTNCILSLCGSEEYTISEESPHGVQMLKIDVRPVDKSQSPFIIRLRSIDYTELRSKLHAPVVNARNIVVKQTVTELFVDAFTETVKANPPYTFNPEVAGYELEPCMGCMQETANVKIVKLCAPPGEGDCQECYCKPLWCIDCLAKWFSYRQDQNNTQTWLSGKAGCPMCRAKFCMADVCGIGLS